MTLAGINNVTDGTEAEEDAALGVLDALSKFGATDAGFSEDVLGSAGDAGMGSSEPNDAAHHELRSNHYIWRHRI